MKSTKKKTETELFIDLIYCLDYYLIPAASNRAQFMDRRWYVRRDWLQSEPGIKWYIPVSRRPQRNMRAICNGTFAIVCVPWKLTLNVKEWAGKRPVTAESLFASGWFFVEKRCSNKRSGRKQNCLNPALVKQNISIVVPVRNFYHEQDAKLYYL